MGNDDKMGIRSAEMLTDQLFKQTIIVVVDKKINGSLFAQGFRKGIVNDFFMGA